MNECLHFSVFYQPVACIYLTSLFIQYFQICYFKLFKNRCGESQCINETKICDNSNDCYNGADESESCHIDECYSKRKRCDHNCHDKPIGYNCTCNKGYDLSPDLHHCQGILNN